MEFDIIVIGTGSGSKIARAAAGFGLTVAIIESGKTGGTCLNHGCIPSKMLIHPADVVDEIQECSKFGIDRGDSVIKVDRSSLVTRVCEDIDGESEGIRSGMAKRNRTTFFPYKAEFVSSTEIRLHDSEKTVIKGKKIFIVAGCRAHVADIEGLAGTPYMTYREALRDPSTPSRVLVIGGGYIAAELGYYYGMTGCKVEFLVRSKMLAAEDDEIQKLFQEDFSKRFRVHLGAVPVKVSFDDGTKVFSVTLKDGSVLQSDALLIATGVTSNADHLNCSKAGIELDSRGFIVVNEQLETNIKGIWALGDIIGRNLFRHTANFEADWLISHLFKNGPSSIEYPPIPHAVFSNPQIGGVGLTESEASLKYPNNLLIGRADYSDTAMGNAILSNGLVKLIFVKNSLQLVGAHILGKEASNMIHICIVFMVMKGKLSDMLSTIYIHPALPEVVRDAARDANSQLLSSKL